MNFKDYLKQIKRLHSLVERKSTGTPDQLARKLNTSRATVFRRVDDLKGLGAEILYDKDRQTYYYRDPFQLVL